MSLFGSSGVRGVINKDFTPELAAMIGMAVGSKMKSAAVGTDSRTAGPMIEAAVSSGLMAAGCEVFHAGLVTTPTLAEASRALGGGVMVTASHNPPEYEGIKLLNPDGSGFGVRQTEAIESQLESKKFKLQPWDKVGTSHVLQDAVRCHIMRILAGVGKSTLKVVVDCANGPASNITPLLLQKMGCKVITINSNPDGHFPGRPPEPTEENLQDVMKAVVSMKADLGIAHDGDADRMMAIDEKGRFVGGDQLLALFAKRYGKKKIVVTVDASMAIDDYVDAEIIRTRVGDVFVSEAVKRSKADFGGEPSGTWIFPDQTYCPDGVLAAARLVELVEEKKLSELRKAIPCYPILRDHVEFDPKNREKILHGIERELKGIECESMLTMDGHRLQFKEGWALIRPSGTEPRIRFLAEARSDALASDIMAIISKAVRECVK
ncbi:MAG: phosphoglucosamine mutase [Euryarchaeota archaeon RBG_19FT_COMBO_56_21]|nr:MAG: phosphoglucosamine mutase [Euryarchaeota archaeon RBG_19FT_COMBO_56_21]